MPQLSRHPALLVALASSGFAAAQAQVAPQAPAPEAPGAARPLQTAGAQQKDLAVWYGHVESDNLERTPAGEEGSWESVGVLVGLARTSTRLDASIDADLEYRRYSLDSLDDETLGHLNAVADVDIVQDRFSWTFRDDYGQGITDPFAGLGPDNREKINVLATGPRLDLPFGGRTSMEVHSTYRERRFDESSNVDSDSVLSELGFYRQASSTARFGLVASWNDVEYVDVVSPDYEIDRLGLRYEKELATGRVLADLGMNEISVAGFASDDPFYNLVWTRSLAARSQLSIRAAQELTDAGGALVSGFGPGIEGSSFTDVVVTPNPFEQQRFGVSYVLTMSRTVVQADIGTLNDDYVGNPAYDNESLTLHASFVRTISPRLSFGVGFNEVDREFADSAAQPDSEDSWIGAWLNRTLGRRFSLGLALAHYERSGRQSYDERRYELRFGYSPTESGAKAMSSVGR